MVTKYRQPIYPGDRGLDVLAVRRAMRKRGFSNLRFGRYIAGGVFVEDIKRVQRAHKLRADGIYGALTHAALAPYFDRYGGWLYRHARIRTRSAYVNPFRHSSSLVPGRIDMGVDFHGYGPIAAIGDAEIVGNGGHGWPGGNYLLYRLLSGPHAGKHVYVAEGIRAVVRGGQRVRAGATVCYFNWDAAPGHFPGIETGWSSPTLNVTWAAATTGYHEGERTRAGKAFARFLRQLGVACEDPGPGPTFE